MDNLSQMPNSYLKYAINTGDVEAFALALQKGDDLHYRSEAGDTMLHFAVSSPHRSPRMIELLVMQGVDVNEPNNLGATPLHVAVMRGDVPAVRSLLRMGADANAAQDNGYTAFHMIAPDTPEHILQLLYRYGGNPDRENGNGHSPEALFLLQGSGDVLAPFRAWKETQSAINPALRDVSTPLKWVFAENGVFAQPDVSLSSWKHLPKCLKKAKVEKFDIAPATMGNIVKAASSQGLLPQVMQALNEQGLRLGTDALLDAQRQPNEAFLTLAKNRDLGAVFTSKNLQSPAELMALYKALPSEFRDQIHNYHTLRQLCEENTPQRGR